MISFWEYDQGFRGSYSLINLMVSLILKATEAVELAENTIPNLVESHDNAIEMMMNDAKRKKKYELYTYIHKYVNQTCRNVLKKSADPGRRKEEGVRE